MSGAGLNNRAVRFFSGMTSARFFEISNLKCEITAASRVGAHVASASKASAFHIGASLAFLSSLFIGRGELRNFSNL
jgi:hypothetical protein